MAAAGGHWQKIAQGNIGSLVFVPKGQTASQAIVGRKATGGSGFPGSPDDTQKIKGLGGSTGATLVQDAGGNLYVKKKGASAGHPTEEGAADSAYQALGMDVPAHQVYQTANGPVKLAKFVEGKTLAQVESNDPAAYGRAVTQLQKGFAVDAVLDNWDVIGFGKDNVLVGNNGKVYRIDNGGSLRYRAQGDLKGTGGTKRFTEFPDAIFSMRAQGTAGQVFGSLTGKQVATQARSLAAKKAGMLKALPSGVRATVAARVARMSQYATIHKTLSLKGLSDKRIDGFVNKLWSGLKSGSIKSDPKSQAEILKAFEVIGG